MASKIVRQAGFTLIELVLVLVVAGIGIAGLAATFGNAASSLSTNEAVQGTAQRAQECAERILASRRATGFPTGTVSCGASPAGFTVSVVDDAAKGTPPYTGTATSACPDGTHCRDLIVTASSGSVSASVTVMLAE